MGTGFVGSEEAVVPGIYKERIISGQAEDTVYSEHLFDIGWANAPPRVLRNSLVREWEAAGNQQSGRRPGEWTTVGSRTRDGAALEIPKYAPYMATPEVCGGLYYRPFWAGQSCRR